MTISITLTCDGCFTERVLTYGDYEIALECGEWAEVMEDKHLCPTCLHKATNKRKKKTKRHLSLVKN